MIRLSLAEIASIVGGTLHVPEGSSADAVGGSVVTGSVEFDTRKVGPGSLFVALPGVRVDGHAFAAQAVAAGAVGVLAAREVDD
ncbi:MAG TPA: Mur ligase domain-containing protein, partial [Umezawaea sp.]|nr:Mur ligase domain-containing protein [Umezawaea sp.]